MSDEERQEISLGDAAKELGVTRATLYYYIHALDIETKKYPLDKKAYMPRADLERIKTLKEQAKQRGGADREENAA